MSAPHPGQRFEVRAGLRRSATDVSGLPNAPVVVVKGALYAIAITALILSVRRARASAL